MIEVKKSKLSARLRSALRRFRGARDGVAAVEFAYIAPILLVMLMATFEISRAVSIDRRLNAVSAMASELVAREESVDQEDLKNIYRSLAHALKPYNDGSLVVRLIQVRTDTSGDTKVEWSTEISTASVTETGEGSTPSLSTPYSQCTNYSIDSDLQQNGTRVVVAEVGYNYAPIFGDFVYRDFSLAKLKQRRNDVTDLTGNWGSKAYHSPRWNCVAYGADNCQTCP